MPECKILEENARNNCESWKNYKVTPEFSKVYQKQGVQFQRFNADTLNNPEIEHKQEEESKVADKLD